MFYCFSQNNSGGTFHVDESVGIGEYVIIEAADAHHANYLADRLGIYFDGCHSGRDCSCCGDRWDPCDEHYKSAIPTIYGRCLDEQDCISIFRENIFIHTQDGNVLKFTKESVLTDLPEHWKSAAAGSLDQNN